MDRDETRRFAFRGERKREKRALGVKGCMSEQGGLQGTEEEASRVTLEEGDTLGAG